MICKITIPFFYVPFKQERSGPIAPPIKAHPKLYSKRRYFSLHKKHRILATILLLGQYNQLWLVLLTQPFHLLCSRKVPATAFGTDLAYCPVRHGIPCGTCDITKARWKRWNSERWTLHCRARAGYTRTTPSTTSPFRKKHRYLFFKALSGNLVGMADQA